MYSADFLKSSNLADPSGILTINVISKDTEKNKTDNIYNLRTRITRSEMDWHLILKNYLWINFILVRRDTHKMKI